jgi:Flp pilus assembly protein TadG
MESIFYAPRDESGAVFVEKLIVYLPLLLTFFGAWELAELGAAHIVVQRASAAAGRAAIVVLADDPAFYDGEEVGNFDGQRQADIELAAGMILSAVPRFEADFSVDVSDPPEGVGPIEVTVTARYDCGLASLVCGSDDSLELTSTTKHTYQGARYAYSSPVVDGGGAALTGQFHSGERDAEAEEVPDAFRGAFRASVSRCEPGAAIERYTNPSAVGRKTGSYGGGLSKEALRYRCQRSYTGNSNVAIIYYRCEGVNKTCTIPGQSGNFASHGERDAMAKFNELKAQYPNRRCSIEHVYTEREPCADQQRCAGWLSGQGLGDRTYYTFDYNPAEVDPRTDGFYRRGREQCADLRADAANCRLPSPPMTSCSALRRWLDKYDGSGKRCMEYLLAKDDFAQQRSRDQWNAQMARDIAAEMRRECSTLRHARSPYGSGQDCVRPPARPEAEILVDIARKRDQLAQARAELARPGPYTDVRRVRSRIERLESDLAKLNRELAAARAQGG